jgi:hypothetical protein
MPGTKPEIDRSQYGVQYTNDALALANGDTAVLELAKRYAQEQPSTCITTRHVQNAMLELRPGSMPAPKPKKVLLVSDADLKKKALIAELKKMGF